MKYLEDYKTLHSIGMMRSKTVLVHKDFIKRMIDYTSTKTILDYGSGNAASYKEDLLDKEWGVIPTFYDPAITEYDILPDGPFDGVISTAVLEHIPEDEIDEAFENIFSRATKMVALTISNRPHSVKLRDMTSIHCTVKPEEWWIERIAKANTLLIPTAVRFVYTKKTPTGKIEKFINSDHEFHIQGVFKE